MAVGMHIATRCIQKIVTLSNRYQCMKVTDSWTCPPCLRREHRGQSTSSDEVQAATTRRNKKDTGLCDRCVSKGDLQK
ncbi:unnamed protein product [Pieris macdunnoughi]|uniref:Uncharacterized protein n=1 Tax=Pieris macdunnoughi TaxID=345717 RepID=A0A821LLR4_9NEOP|nr:unnamed protein product [Pieris macdunnoughi]